MREVVFSCMLGLKQVVKQVTGWSQAVSISFAVESRLHG